MRDEHAWVEQLEMDGLLTRAAFGLRLTKRWKVAFARITVDLARRGVPLTDVRIPIAQLLVDAYPDATEPSVTVGVGVVLPLVIDELTYVAALSPSYAKMD